MRYPIGRQDFRTLRADENVYVDKTAHICRMLREGGKYLFLSRPRRFGKSLTVSTVKELYSGDRELFRGLSAYHGWGFAERRRPVIHVKFDESGFQTSGLPAAINRLIDDESRRLGTEAPPGDDYGVRFKELVRAAAASHPSGRCVVLVDEYDKPIVNYLGEPARAVENRDLLRPFYGVLKGLDEYLELVFITGVSAFSKASLFSDLNNLRSLTLDPLAHALVGLTEAELDANFAEQLDATGYTRGEIREWYNGYTWGGERVYNPWSLLQLLASGQRENYWSTSGTPKFVVDVLAREGAYDLAGERRSAVELTGFDLERLDLAAVLFQGGYLTLAGRTQSLGGDLYALRYPNREVHQTFLEALLAAYGFRRAFSPLATVDDLLTALRRRDLERVGEIVDALLANVPYELWRGATERFYHAIIHTAFSLLGLYSRAEVSTRRGRADVLVEVAPYAYALEFKLLRPTAVQLSDEDARAAAAEALAAEALAQIAEGDYLATYATGPLKSVAVAVVFDAERRAVALLREG